MFITIHRARCTLWFLYSWKKGKTSFQVIWWRNLEDWEEKFKRRIPQPRAALGVQCSQTPCSISIAKTQQIIPCLPHFLNIQVHPTSSNLASASAMLNWKIRPRAVVGYGVKIFHPGPPNYVTRSPGCLSARRSINTWNYAKPNRRL